MLTNPVHITSASVTTNNPIVSHNALQSANLSQHNPNVVQNAKYVSSLPRTVSHPRIQQPSYSTITHATHNDNITKSKQKDPDKFDGKSIEWRDYIVHFEKVAMWNNWSDTDKAQQLAMSLRGQAQKLFGELKPSEMNDYEQLKTILTRRYDPQERSVACWCEFRSRRRQKNETPSDFAYALRRLACLAYPEMPYDYREINVLEQYLNTVGTSEIKEHVIFRHPKSVDEAISHTVEYEAVKGVQTTPLKPTLHEDVGYVQAVKQNQIQNTESPSNIIAELNNLKQTLGSCLEKWNTTLQQLQNENNVKSQKRTPRDFTNYTCFSCKEKGHIAKDCPKQQKQQVFGKLEQADCVAEKPASYNKNRRPNVNKISNSSLLARTIINGQIHKLLVDTGSSSSLLSENMVEQLFGPVSELQPVEKSNKLTTADGAPLDIKGKMILEFSLGDLMFHHEFYVANIDLPGILGLDFLEQFDITIKVSSASLQIGDRCIDLEREDSVQCARVKFSKKVVIPPETEMVVKAYAKGEIAQDCEVMVEPFKNLSRKGLLVSNSVVQPNKILLSVLNVTKKPIHVKQHSLVGSLTPVEVHSFDTEKASLPVDPNEFPEHLQPLLDGTSDSLTDDQVNSVKQLLYEYKDVFMGPDGKLGRTDLVKHTIDTGTVKPIKIPPRRAPQKQKQIIEQEINKMLADDIIEPSTSPWSSPILLATKKDGSIRFCLDYRRLNAVTIKDAYPLPRMDDSLDALSGSKWFSTLDLVSGYWQAEIAESDRPKTAFASHKGLFQFKVLPFGLSNAPSVFERLMELVLRGLNWEKCLCYLDDVIVFGKTFEEALDNLRIVFQRFRDSNLKLKPTKCSLFQTKVGFLGHEVSEKGISCDPKKIESIQNWPVPADVSEVKSFLGLVGYYRKLIKNFSTVAFPLTELTHKGKSFIWTEACQLAYESLKSCLISSPILSYPIEDGDFILDTDASSHGIGAVLSQVQHGEETVVAYASRTLSKTQQRYCTTYRELLAVVTFIKQFRHYLWGRKFIVRSDHAALKWIKNFKNPEGMIARWLSVLSTYDFTIEYRRGTAHTNADALSRKHRVCKNTDCLDCSAFYKTSEKAPIAVPSLTEATANINGTDNPVVNHVASVMNYSSPDASIDKPNVEPDKETFAWIKSWSNDEIKQWQNVDTDISKFKELKRTYNNQPHRDNISNESRDIKCLWSLWDLLEIEDDILKYRWYNTSNDSVHKLLVAPKEIRQTIFQKLHCDKTAGHFGRRRTIDAIHRNFYWPGMTSHIRRWLKQCDLCSRRKPGPGKGRSPLQQSRSLYPLSRIAIDILECPPSANGNTYIIIGCDYFTKWAEAYPVPDHTALTVADKIVNEFISRFGVPFEIHTDQGREFESQLFSRLCETLQIMKTRTCPYRPQSDGLVERFNRTLLQMLSMYVNKNQTNWDDQLPFVLMAYRSTIHESTGCSPNMLMLNRECSLPIDIIAGNPPVHPETKCPIQYIEWITYTVNKTYDFVYKNLEKAANLQKKYYDVGLKVRKYKPNDFVWRWYPPLAKLKLGLGWTGPYKVLNMLSSVTCIIQKDPVTKPIVVHVDHLKPYEGHSIPSTWQDIQIDTTPKQALPDMNESANSDNILDDSTSEPYVTRYGRQIVRPSLYRP